MTIRFRCAHCNQRLRAVDRLTGQSVRCPRCEAKLRVPPLGGDEVPALVIIEPPPPPAEVPTAPAAEEAGRIVITSEDLADVDDWRPPPAPRPWPAAVPTPPAARPRPAGDEHAGKMCPYCQSNVARGEQVVVCAACGIPHHVECWRENGGCTTFGCEACPPPIARGPYAAAPTGQRPWVCRHCGGLIDPVSSRCPFCGAAGRGASGNPEAATALALTIFGLLFPLLLPIAIWQGARALQRVERDPTAGGDRTALAAIVLSTVAGVIWIAAFFSLISAN